MEEAQGQRHAKAHKRQHGTGQNRKRTRETDASETQCETKEKEGSLGAKRQAVVLAGHDNMNIMLPDGARTFHRFRIGHRTGTPPGTQPDT